MSAASLRWGLRIFLAGVVVVGMGGVVRANELVNGGFEVVEPIGGGTGGAVTSTMYGEWFGDWANEIVTTQDGITPFDGSRMMYLYGTTSSGPGATAATGADVGQLVDISAYSSAIAAARAVAVVTGYVNRVSGDAQTDTQFRLRIRTFADDVSTYPDNTLNFTRNQVALLESDGDVQTWEVMTTSLILPIDTEYLGVVVSAFENVFNDTTFPELDGHYVDGIVLELRVLCEGDVNDDSMIDVNDISYVLFRLGEAGPEGDANGDGTVDVNDISFVLFRLGDAC